MKVFVFMEAFEDKFNFGMLSEDSNISQMMVVKDAPATQVREVLNSIPSECIFVGRNLRQGVLTKLMYQLCQLKLDLPEKLKFHWVAPYKLPFDDLDWLYNFGTYKDGFVPLSEMGSNLGVQVDMSSNCHIEELAKMYFTLIGDFSKLQ